MSAVQQYTEEKVVERNFNLFSGEDKFFGEGHNRPLIVPPYCETFPTRILLPKCLLNTITKLYISTRTTETLKPNTASRDLNSSI